MTTSTGEDRDLNPATSGGAIPADTYAHRLMLARAHAGNLSIRAAAERCGLNHANWSNWEQGMRSRTAFDDARAISEGLGVDLDWLIWGGPLAKPAQTSRSRRDRHGRRGGSELLSSSAELLSGNSPPRTYQRDAARRPGARPAAQPVQPGGPRRPRPVAFAA